LLLRPLEGTSATSKDAGASVEVRFELVLVGQWRNEVHAVQLRLHGQQLLRERSALAGGGKRKQQNSGQQPNEQQKGGVG